MRLLIIAERFYPEEFLINDLAIEWIAKGYDVTVLTQTPSYPYDRVYKGHRNKLFQKNKWGQIIIYRVFTILGYKRSVFYKIIGYLSFALFTSIVALFIGNKFDKVFVYQTGPLIQATAGVVVKKFFRKALFLWVFDVWPDSVYAYGFKRRRITDYILDTFVSFIYSNCNKIFISSNGFRDVIEKYVSASAVKFVPQWAPKEMMQGDNGVPIKYSGDYNFTFAGNIGKVQNLENVIKGFTLAQRENKCAHLNIIGDGSNLKAIKKIVEDENIENVIFWGRRPLNEMLSWLSASDVLVLSLTNAEIFAKVVPAKFQAYLFVGKPIFCIMKGETAKIVQEHGIGEVSEPDDIMDIKDKFCRFISKKQSGEFVAVHERMINLLNDKYDKNKIISEMENLIFS